MAYQLRFGMPGHCRVRLSGVGLGLAAMARRRSDGMGDAGRGVAAKALYGMAGRCLSRCGSYGLVLRGTFWYGAAA